VNTNSKINFAIIGCGHIGKRHIEMLMRNTECKVIAACDILPEKTINTQHEGVKFYNDAKQMLLDNPVIDVVCICTPNGLHAAQALMCLDAGKHVVIEKPMALTKADCEKIIFKSLQVSRHVFCVMQNRYSPPSVWLKEIIETKTLGDVFIVQLVCYWNRDSRYYKGDTWHGTADLDGGTLFTQFSHWIDLLYWLFGDIKDILTTFADYNHAATTAFEDSGIIQFKFENGAMGSINYSTSVWDKNLESSLTVIGSKGSIKVGGQYMNEVEYCHIENYTMPSLEATNPANDYGAYKGSANNHHLVFTNVVNTLKGETSATTNALEGLKVVEIIERIYQQNTLNKKGK
jgi:predicted dehydrogenase